MFMDGYSNGVWLCDVCVFGGSIPKVGTEMNGLRS